MPARALTNYAYTTTLTPQREPSVRGEDDIPAAGNVILVTAPKSLRELFDQIGLEEVPSTDGTVVMEMPVDERVTNTAGGLQGGLIATLVNGGMKVTPTLLARGWAETTAPWVTSTFFRML